MKFILAIILFLSAIVGGYYWLGNYIHTQKMERAENAFAKMVAERKQKLSEKENVPQKKIVVNLASRMLSLYERGVRTRIYMVGVGTTQTPSPMGEYVIVEKIKNPSWTNPKDESIVIPSGASNPLGYRWMGFSGTYGIHGTNLPHSIGHYVSNGCIRMKENDVEELFELVPQGTPLSIVYDRFLVDRQVDGSVLCYTYPDGYGWEKFTVEKALEEVAPYGLGNFVDRERLAAHISAENGQPFFLGKLTELSAGGMPLEIYAISTEKETWIPLEALSQLLGIAYQYDKSKKEVRTKYGRAEIFVKKDILYIRPQALLKIFRIEAVKDKEYLALNFRREEISDLTAMQRLQYAEVKEILLEKSKGKKWQGMMQKILS